MAAIVNIRPRDANELPAIFDHAPCRRPGNAVRFADADRKTKDIQDILALCRACPALDECDKRRQHELTQGRYAPAGVWAGRINRSAKTLADFKAGV